MQLHPGDLILTFCTDRHTVEIRGDLTSREEGRVYRYTLALVNEGGNTKSFGMHASVVSDLEQHVGLTPKEAHSIQRHLDEIGRLVRKWDC